MNQITYLFEVNFFNQQNERDFRNMRGANHESVKVSFETSHPECKFINCSRTGN